MPENANETLTIITVTKTVVVKASVNGRQMAMFKTKLKRTFNIIREAEYEIFEIKTTRKCIGTQNFQLKGIVSSELAGNLKF